MPYHYRSRRKPPPPTPCLSANPPAPSASHAQVLLPGVHPLIAEVAGRCNPIRQPDVLLYGPTLKPSNIAELARRAFRVHYIQDAGFLWGAQCLGARPFLLPHQYERLENTAGGYRLLPLRDSSVDAMVCIMEKPFENRGDLLVTLCEAMRVLRRAKRYAGSTPFILLRGVIPTLPRREGGNGRVPFTAAQEYWEDAWPMAAEAGFIRLEPTIDATGLDLYADPPAFTWRLTPV